MSIFVSLLMKLLLYSFKKSLDWLATKVSPSISAPMLPMLVLSLIVVSLSLIKNLFTRSAISSFYFVA